MRQKFHRKINLINEMKMQRLSEIKNNQKKEKKIESHRSRWDVG